MGSQSLHGTTTYGDVSSGRDARGTRINVSLGAALLRVRSSRGISGEHALGARHLLICDVARAERSSQSCESRLHVSVVRGGGEANKTAVAVSVGEARHAADRIVGVQHLGRYNNGTGSCQTQKSAGGTSQWRRGSRITKQVGSCVGESERER